MRLPQKGHYHYISEESIETTNENHVEMSVRQRCAGDGFRLPGGKAGQALIFIGGTLKHQTEIKTDL
jgi:hypothetical protein